MELYLSLGGIKFRLYFEKDIVVTPEYKQFFVQQSKSDVNVNFKWDWTFAPDIKIEQSDNNSLNFYSYQSGDHFICVKRDSCDNIIICISYTKDFNEVNCYINDTPLNEKFEMLASFMRMLPLCRIFTHFGVLFFHAAQIGYRGKGILFTAPSGTGKTTQARLWESSRGAEILCNDRTLVRKSGDEWQTCGFPLDGSTPVANNRTCPLRAIVYLEQGSQCRCERLSPSKALLHLMPQMVIDGWDPQIRAECMRQLLSLMEKIPVYRLVCTPDVRAVEALELQLSKE